MGLFCSQQSLLLQMTAAPTVTGQPVLLLRDSQVLSSLPKPFKAGPRHLVLLYTFKSFLLNKQIKHYVQEHVLFLSWHLIPSNTHPTSLSQSPKEGCFPLASTCHPPCPQVGTESEGQEPGYLGPAHSQLPRPAPAHPRVGSTSRN